MESNIFQKRSIITLILIPLLGLVMFGLALVVRGSLGIIISLLGVLMLFYPTYRLYQINLDLLKADSNAPSKYSWFISLLLMPIFIGVIYYFYILFKFCKSLDKNSSGNISSAGTLVLFIFAYPVALIFMQYKVNKLASNEPEKVQDNSNEEKSKEYILKYKDNYPRESIKTSLLNTGIPKNEVEEYLNKYF